MQSYFSDVTDLFLIQLCIAAICGFAFGLERQLRGKPFGVRTCILICAGTMLFVTLGQQLAGAGTDPTRVLGQVITGIGFIGAGVILARDGYVKGITSSAVVWILAGVGAAVGLQRFGTALITTGFGVTTLFICQRLETAIKALQRGVHKHHDHDNDHGHD
ncbi:MAG: MgtC/SapB family protein [Oligoflexales bacterium]